MGERLQEAMSECFEKKSLIKFEHVDIGHELEKRGMLDMWPTEVLEHRLLRVNTFFYFASEAWPPSLAVGKLAATLKKRKKQGQQNAFVCVDLRECAT